MSDEVYYKRDKSEEWYGPAKVILIEGKVITVKHGGVTVKVNTVSLVKIPHICTPECELRDSGHKRNESVMPENQVSDVQNRWDRNKSIIPKEVATDRVEPLVLDNETYSSCSGNKNMISKGVTGDTHRKGKHGLPIMPPDVIRDNKNVAEPNWIGTECVAETIDSDREGRIEDNLPSNGKRKRKITDDTGSRKKAKNDEHISSIIWRRGERFQGIDSVTGEYVSGKILSRVEGANQNLYNVESDQDGY